MFLSDAVPSELAATVAKELNWVDRFFEQAGDKSHKKPTAIGAIPRSPATLLVFPTASRG